MKNRSICFLLPIYTQNMVGGYKVAYEYANMFSKNGYKVFVYWREFSHKNVQQKKVSKYQILKNIVRQFIGYKQKINTFKFQKNVHTKFIPFIAKKYLPKSDYYVSTAIDTAYALSDVHFNHNAKKLYLIQDFENWNNVGDEYVYNSYKLPLKKIVISPWLLKEVQKTGENATLIENGFDFDYFIMSTPIEQKQKNKVVILFHKDDRKRFVDSYEALKIVKQKIPELTVNIFGAFEKPDYLPDWFDFYYMPDKETHNRLYNEACVFLGASKAEGMALPPAEAMICGCACCLTDIPGFAVYAKNNETALLSPVYDVKKLAENLYTLLTNDELRIKIAKQGNTFIKQFTWEKAFEKFIGVLN